MIREIIYGLCGNFIFSLCLFTYKKYNHKHYDEIIERLKRIEANKSQQQFLLEHKDKVGYFTDDKCENIKWLPKDNFTPKEDHYKK